MLVSLIVPVYNVCEYLPTLLDSAVSQTHQELEIILIDDGSTDSSGIICDEYAKIDKRIKVIHKSNGGVSDARNIGIDVSSGDYIVFADGDDYLSYDYVKYLLELCTKNCSDISCCAWTFVNGSKKIKCSFRAKEPGVYNGKHESMRALLTTRLMSSSSCGKMFKRQLFDTVRFPRGINCHEDDATMYRLVALADSVAIGNEYKYYYVQRAGSAMHRAFDDEEFSIIKIFEERCEFIEKEYPELTTFARSDVLMVVNHCVIKMCDDQLFDHPQINGLKEYYKRYEKYFLKGISYFPAKLFSLVAYINIRIAMRLYSLTGKHNKIN